MLDLGTLGGLSSNGTGINDAKQVVGSADIDNGESHPFVTDAHGKMQDLNSLLFPGTAGWNLINANAINNAGQITGMGLHDGVMRAFLLTPVAGLANADLLRLSESQKDEVKCGPFTPASGGSPKFRDCSQNTTGAYSVMLKLSVATLTANKLAIDQLDQNTPLGITIGTFTFSGTLADADPNKTHLSPVNLPGTWTQQHTVCARYNAEGGCLLYKPKPVIDGKVIINADKKHNLIFNLSGKKSVVEGADKGQQIYASLCQASGPGKSQQTENMSINIGEITIPLSIQISCNVTRSNKMPPYSTTGPFELNNMAIKAVLNPV
jgi:probable HAF family extracellular repeat protein